MTSPPSSLRDFYAAPSNAWSFIPPLAPGAPENSTGLYESPSSSSYQWSTRTNASPLFDLSTGYAEHDAGINVTVVVKGLLATAAMQYCTTAITMPWQVGRTLLQVQWVPRNTGEVPPGAVLATDIVDEDGELSDSSNDNDAYFADLSELEPGSTHRPPLRPADERGYIVRQTVLEEGTIPEYTIPVGTTDGTWSMIKQLRRFRAEGLLTTVVTDALSAGLRPICSSFLQATFSPLYPSLSSAPPNLSSNPLFLPVASHVLTGLLLSPLDLIRTRLIVQSAHPRYRTYSGPLDALGQILTHEGGFRGIYLHPHLLIPTLLDCTLRALVPLVLPGFIASHLGFGVNLTPETHPLLWTLTTLVGDCASFLITLPFETVRKRLQVQVRGTAKPLRACVELRPAPYNGVVDAMWHIVTEERSDLPIKSKNQRRKAENKDRDKEADAAIEENASWLRNTGIGQLYRGLGIRVTASLVMFALAVIGGDEPDAGWAEL
ncbi:uncharacterized protein FIBRA_02358 [Fibroporia radiculosa]|uniref:Mitochondrial carrier n=1 Tax=Fibroporia radiculosa TaxID=599839 RepID=J4G1M8_9APHY|nr:uncharacterized protein FIBRA_02358 [Fibroporia radiculosa]CCM00328.1 predicted protein [Fibroporia radiculosa]